MCQYIHGHICVLSFTRAECEAEVKRYPGAVYKGFSDRTEADSFAYAGPSGSARERYARDFPSSRCALAL